MYRFSKTVTNCNKGGQLHSCAVLHIDHNEKGCRQCSSMRHFLKPVSKKKVFIYPGDFQTHGYKSVCYLKFATIVCLNLQIL
jgi:hypothetical protein